MSQPSQDKSSGYDPERDADPDYTTSHTSPHEQQSNSHNDFLKKQLRTAYKKSVIGTKGGRLCVDLANFNRVILESSRRRLVEAAFQFVYGGDDKENDFTYRAEDLSQYVSAWKSLEFMTQTRKKSRHDPFVVSMDNTMQQALLEDVREEILKYLPPDGVKQLTEDFRRSKPPKGAGPPHDPGIPDDPDHGGGYSLSNFMDDLAKRYAGRVTMAIIGGLFIIGPMLVMVLHPGLVTSLVTTSICVFLCGVIMSAVLPKMEGYGQLFDAIAVTTAYAAVLVVFVGTGAGA